jgi:hypothetical protein
MAAACALGFALVAAGGGLAAADTPGSEWYLVDFHYPDLHKAATGAGVTVALVGTGVDPKQSAVAQALIPGADVSGTTPGTDTDDVATGYDGTRVATLIGGDGGAGLTGLAPSAKIMPVRVQTADEKNPDSAQTARGVRYAVDHGAKVVLVLSTVTTVQDDLVQAVRYAITHDDVVISPSGNNGSTDNSVDPVCGIAGVVCVAGTDQNGKSSPESSTGSEVDLGAPSKNLLVPTKSGVTVFSSSHYAAALTAAEAALIFSVHPSWTQGQVIRDMLGHTSGGNADGSRKDNNVGYGIIDPLAAVNAAAPQQTDNPLGTPSAAPPPQPPATHAAPGSSSSSSGSSGSSLPLILGIVGAVVVLGGALLGWLFFRRRHPRNYLNDPGYGAGQLYVQPTATINPDAYGGGQNWAQVPQSAPQWYEGEQPQQQPYPAPEQQYAAPAQEQLRTSGEHAAVPPPAGGWQQQPQPSQTPQLPPEYMGEWGLAAEPQPEPAAPADDSEGSRAPVREENE